MSERTGAQTLRSEVTMRLEGEGCSIPETPGHSRKVVKGQGGGNKEKFGKRDLEKSSRYVGFVILGSVL